MMTKMMTLLTSVVMALSLAACGGKGEQIPSPFSECSSLEEAAENAGFSFDVPDSLDGYAQRFIWTMAGVDDSAMIEVIYQNETDGDESTDSRDEICMRKAEGNEDISGDYIPYSEINTITVGNIQVTIKGENGKANLAVWTDNGYTYSIGVYSKSGISTEEMSGLIAAVR